MAWTAALNVTAGNPTKETDYDNLANNAAHMRDSSGNLSFARAATQRFNVDNGSTVWSLGMWQSSDGRWWLLVRTADASSFTRGQADAYLPFGDINDGFIPAS